MEIIKKIPWWGWIVAVVIILAAFGETKVSVGNVTVNGVDMGGYNSEDSAKKK